MPQARAPRPWPWPPWREPVRRQLSAMLGELRGLELTGGEASICLRPEGFEPGRWLAGFDPRPVAPARLATLPQRLGMPAALASAFRARCAEARQIGLALAQGARQSVAKVYLEYPLSAAAGRIALQIEGHKWDLAEPARASTTEYWRLPDRDGTALVRLLHDAAGVAETLRPLYRGLSLILAHALAQAPHWRGQRLLVVREPDSSRAGLGLRFYGSGLSADEALQPLAAILAAWAWPEARIEQLRATLADHELGWLHAGLDAQGHPFITVYCALTRAQIRDLPGAVGSLESVQAPDLREILL